MPAAEVENLVRGEECLVTVEGAQSDASDQAYTATAIGLTGTSRVCLKNKNCTKRMFYFPFS